MLFKPERRCCSPPRLRKLASCSAALDIDPAPHDVINAGRRLSCPTGSGEQALARRRSSLKDSGQLTPASLHVHFADESPTSDLCTVCAFNEDEEPIACNPNCDRSCLSHDDDDCLNFTFTRPLCSPPSPKDMLISPNDSSTGAIPHVVVTGLCRSPWYRAGTEGAPMVWVERAHYREYTHILELSVCVRNTAFEKKVMGRYTLNNWATCADIVGEYAYTSQDGQIDTFIVLMQQAFGLVYHSRAITVPRTFGAEDKLQFCVSYEVEGRKYWDSGPDGTNYVAHAVYGSPPLSHHEYHRTIFTFDPATVQRWSAPCN